MIIITLAIILLIFLLLLIGEIPLDLYLVPLFLSGIVSLNNAIKCLRHSYFYTNIYLIVWFIMFLNSFIAPIIHFRNDFWLEHMIWYPSNWNTYAFFISSIYFIGILILSFFLNMPVSYRPTKYIWNYKPDALLFVILLMFVSFIVQTIIYFKFGGILEYIRAYSESTKMDSNFLGLGKWFMLSEIFPLLLILYFIIKYREKRPSAYIVFIFLFILFVSSLYFGGLRGSRSNTLFTLIQGIITVHVLVFKFKWKHLIFFIAFFFIFMYAGRLYKDVGINLLTNYEEAAENRNNERITQVETIIIGDLSRYAINAYQLYRFDNLDEYTYKYGQTYLSGILTFIPFGTSIRDYLELTQRTEAAGELLYTTSSGYTQDGYRNTRIYGLVGEWFLNFGIFTFFMPYVLISFMLRWIRKKTISISIKDTRIVLVPIVLILIPNLLLSDFNNIIFFVIKRFVIMFFILYLITKKESVNV